MSDKLYIPFILMSLCCAAGCARLNPKGNGAHKVLIVPLGYGQGDVTRTPRTPRLTYSPEGEEVSCRKEPPNLYAIEGVEGIEVISKVLLRDLLDQAEQDTEGQRRPKEPVTTQVSGGWIRMGLYISNTNTGPNYTLMINRLEFFGDGGCDKEGLPACKMHKTIAAGYCGLPFLYLAPPQKKIEYKPVSSDPLQNLVLYVDGFPIIDRTTEDPEDRSKKALPGGAFYILPRYRITMIAVGEFLLKDGTVIEPFVKKIQFSTSQRRSY